MAAIRSQMSVLAAPVYRGSRGLARIGCVPQIKWFGSTHRIAAGVEVNTVDLPTPRDGLRLRRTLGMTVETFKPSRCREINVIGTKVLVPNFEGRNDLINRR